MTSLEFLPLDLRASEMKASRHQSSHNNSEQRLINFSLELLWIIDFAFCSRVHLFLS